VKLPDPVTVQEICALINARHSGRGNELVLGINEIHKVSPGDLTFVDFEKYYQRALDSPAGFIIINKVQTPPENKVLIFSEEPFRDYNRLVRHFFPKMEMHNRPDSADIHPTARIYEGVFIGNDVCIGKDTVIYPNVTIYDHTIIGERVVIHSGSVIGADAFYFKRFEKPEPRYEKLESCGRVIIEDDVEIGAACTIDSGVSGDTVIGKGTKIDNQVHVGHGTVIGKRCLIAAQVGIAGKVTIGDEVILWGQVGISKDLVIGDWAEVYAQSGVAKSLPGGQAYFGSPAKPALAKMKELAMMQYMPDWWEWMKKREWGNGDAP